MIRKLMSVYSTNVILGVLGVITVPILLKSIGIEGYGYYGIYLTVLSYFTLFELGIIKHFTKLISRKNEEVDDIISCFYFFTISIIVVCSPIVTVFVNYLFGVGWIYAILISLVVSIEYVFYLPTKIYSSYAVAKKNFERLSFFNFLSGLIRYGLLIIGALFIQNIFIVISLLAIRRIFDVNLSKKILGEKISIFKINQITKANLKKVIGYYKESLYLSGTQALQINLNGMLSLIVSRFFGVEGLGVFRSTYDLLSKIWFFSNGLGLVVFPYFTSNKINANKYRRFIFLSWLFYSLIFILVILLFPLLNKLLLEGTLTANEHFFLFLFLLISILLIAQGNLSFEFLQANGNYKYLMLVTLAVNVSFLIFALVLSKYILYTYSVIFGWMLSVMIQTVCFEFKSLNRSGIILVFSLLIILSWLTIGFFILFGRTL
ncbi:hypothetical protein [Paenibacillus sp. IITD108]|uniref:hypothetical protein n=1 Tax=Paenibacillus sp. IITD108 TaxID=3116649 RepID=UPI002F41DCE6